ncbi:hypothetical protein [Psychrobacillus sp. L3]|uniref:hypothetical protein n=1 Tax=Psychrobacillus sp. L3 TaxID=3236891 RepID=UPI0036F42CC0
MKNKLMGNINVVFGKETNQSNIESAELESPYLMESHFIQKIEVIVTSVSGEVEILTGMDWDIVIEDLIDENYVSLIE